MTVTTRFSLCLAILLCSLLFGCGPFVVTETAYDADGEVGSETVEYNDGPAPGFCRKAEMCPTAQSAMQELLNRMTRSGCPINNGTVLLYSGKTISR